VSLTLGSGPFARRRTGTFNFDIAAAAPAHVIYLDDVPQRLRATLAGETVLDTRRAKVLYESNIPPVWYVPLDDVRPDLLTPADNKSYCQFKGDATYWTLRVGDRVEENVGWSYPTPLPGAPVLTGYVAFYVDRLDAWFEEDDEVFGHARDRFHRVDVRRSSDHVVVRVGGEVVAETSRPVKLFETSLPTRWYVPRADVRPEALVASDTQTVCPYKGATSYHSLRAGEVVVPDGAWYLPEPRDEALLLAGHVCFDGEGVEMTVNGEPVGGH
jgi:uncharacterized protein (DUF427 family)